MRTWKTLIGTGLAVVTMTVSTTSVATAAEVDSEPDFLPGVCHLYSHDDETELIWLLQIHDPALGCVDGFSFDGHEITIDQLRDDLLWNVVGFDEGNVFSMAGTVPSAVYRFDADAVGDGVPLTSFIAPEHLVAAGDVAVNFNIQGTQAPGDGIDVVQLTVRGLGELTAVGGGSVRYTATVHEEVDALTPAGLVPTKVLAQLRLHSRP